MSKEVNLLEKVKKFVDEHIRAMLQADGGDIEVVDVDAKGVVHVRLTGTCANCAGSAMTLSAGVEHRIRESLPEVTAVEQIS